MNYADYNNDQLKALHNKALADARASAQEAAKLRDALIERTPSYRGSSKANLGDAIRLLFLARTFADAPYDLAADENPYRNGLAA